MKNAVFSVLEGLKALINILKEIRIHYIVLSRPSQKCEGLFVLKSDLNVVFMGVSGGLRTDG